MPTTSRPADSWSSVAICRASTHGRRRASGVTMGPSRMLVVVIAIAASVVQVSATAMPGDASM